MKFQPKRLKFVKPLNEITSEVDKLVYGKNNLDRIVSVENKDGELHIFRQLENGKIEVLKQPSNFWVITNENVSDKQTELKGDQYYKYIATFPTMKERDDVVKILKENNIDNYRIYEQKEQSLVYEGMTYFKGLKPSEVSILSWDLETYTLKHDPDTGKILIISNTFRDHKGKITKKLFSLDNYDGDEAAMIRAWVKWVREIDPSIMLGHNCYGFDWEYLRWRCRELGVKLALGRDGSNVQFAKYESSFRKDGSQSIDYINCNIFGREIADSMFLSYQYDIGRAFPSYGLKPIINFLGKEKPNRTFVDAAKIGRYYDEFIDKGECENWELAKQYAKDDSDDSLTLFDIMVPAKFYSTQSVSKPFQSMVNSATGSQINNIMVRSYLQIGHSIAKATDAIHYEGAISFGIAGIYKNGLKVDVSSLYPSIMRQYEVYSKEKDPLKHFVLITEYFATERLKNKKLAKETGDQYYEDLQQSQKVMANSLYGFLGAAGLNYNYPEGAAFITKSGREVLEKATIFATGQSLEYWKNKALVSVGDTDGEEAEVE